MAVVRQAVRGSASIPLDRCAAVVKQLVCALETSDEPIRQVLTGHTEDYQISNAVHVAVLSVKIGMGLHAEAPVLQRLALAGLLHDVGMWLVPDTVIRKSDALTSDERALIRAHPEQGRRLAASWGDSSDWLATTIAQEHERWDGSGYPCHLRGGAIHEYAQIVGLADTLDALITARPYRKRLTPHHALRNLVTEHKQAFSPQVLKAVMDQVSLYPVGTTVRLNDGQVGVVSKVNPRLPLRPVIVMMRTAAGDGRSERIPVDLRQESTIHVVEVIPSEQAA
ncbi:MAG: HD domain-containing phosphohydrolase [Nitrospira sp.]